MADVGAGGGGLSGIRLRGGALAFSSSATLELFESIPVAICVTAGREHRFVYANRHYRQALIPQCADPIGRSLAELYGPGLPPATYSNRERVLGDGRPLTVPELPAGHTADGAAMYWEITYFPVLGDGGVADGILTFAVDVTEKVRARHAAERQAKEERLRGMAALFDRERLKLALDATDLGIWEWNVETGVVEWSARQKEIWGLEPDSEVSYETWQNSLHPEDRGNVLARVEHTLDPASGGDQRMQHRIVRPNGGVRWIASRGRMLYDEETGRPLRLIGTVLDITSRKRAESELKEALEAKEVLLREVNHRVKNSLQLVSSMLTLQGSRSDDATIQRLVREAQARLRIVAAVHERLYRSRDLGFVDLDVFLETLCRDVQGSALGADDAIVISVAAEPVRIANDHAVPIALILNEMLTNAIKYAYPGGRGVIDVTLRNVSDRQTMLAVADGGIGLPEDFELRRGASLGLRIIDGLARQVHGEVRVRSLQPGTVFEVVFPAGSG